MPHPRRVKRPLWIAGAASLLLLWIGAHAATSGLSRTVIVSEGTNLSATVSPDRKSIIVDLQETLWALPAAGGTAKRLTDPLLEPARPDWSPKGDAVAFQSYKGGTFHIWLMKPDGTGVRQLTDGHSDDRDPRFSPDGTRVPFSSDRGLKGDYDIWVAEISTGKLTRWTSDPADEFEPAWSRDGGEIAFVSGTGSIATAIRAVNGSGEARLILTAPPGAHVNSPSWSPDGKQVAYTQIAGNKAHLMVSEKRVGTAGDVFPFPARWLSADQILYTANGKILTTSLATGATKTIPFQAKFELNRAAYKHRVPDFDSATARSVKGILSPVLSPDGKHVVFEALNQLWLFEIGSTAVPLTHDGFYKQSPAWSPDGARLAYSCDKGGTADVYVLDLATRTERRVTNLRESAGLNPVWAPDGKRLAFQKQDGTTYIADLESGEIKEAIKTMYEPGKPSWSANGKALSLAALRPYSKRFREGANLIVTAGLETGKYTYTEPAPYKSISTRGVDGPLYSPDGSQVAFVMDGYLWVRPVDADGIPISEARPINEEMTDAPSWSGDGKWLLYLSNGKLRLVAADGKTAPSTVPLDLPWRRETSTRKTVIHAGRLWDGTGPNVRSEIDLTIVGRRIQKIEPHREDAHQGADAVVDASNLMVMPGLWESHNHRYGGLPSYGDRAGRIWLAYGITTLQSQGDPAYAQMEVKESFAAGARIGPRYFASGEPIDGERAYYASDHGVTNDKELQLELDRAQALEYDNLKTYVRLSHELQQKAVFAGMWQLEMKTWTRTSGGPGSGLFKSSDGGATWKRLSDAADRWELMSVDRQLQGRSAYYTRCAVSPDNENEVYFLSAAFSRTLDGGRTLSNTATPPGGDNHDMWIDPTNGDRLAVANDSGFSISVNRGRTWNRIQLPIAQMYHVTVDNQIPYFVYGNKQDGTSYRGPSNSLAGGGRGGAAGGEEGVPAAPGAVAAEGGGGRGPLIPRGAWHQVTGGESGFATPDPVDSNIIWSSASGSGSVGGIVTVFDERNHQARNVEVWPEQTSGATAAELKYRFNWEFPLTISPHDHNKVYVGSQHVHVTTDAGHSWKAISPDLTRNDKSRQQFSGGLTGDNIGVEYAGVVFAIAESPKETGVIWAGTNDGLVQITRDGGKNWTDVTANIPGLPEWGTVSNIEASRFDAGTAYLTFDLHQVNNRDPFIYKTADYGKSWIAITDGIPHSMLSYAHCVREDPARKGLLFVGTENGLYVSFNDGGRWQPLQGNLPHAPVYWIAMQEHFHDLVLATYGRGFWILDNLTALEQITPQVVESSAYLFAPRDAYRFRNAVQAEGMPYDPTAGQNPPYGAAIDYYLKSVPQAGARIAILDSEGRTVRTIPGAVQPGVNRIWWDLRFTPTKAMRLRTSPEYAPEIGVGVEGWRPAPAEQRIGLLAPPGAYTIKLTVEGKDYTRPLKLLKDPHSNGTEGDIQLQTRLMTSLTGQLDGVVDAVNQIELLLAQLADLKSVMGIGNANATVLTPAEGLRAKLVEIEAHLIRTKVTGRGQDGVRWSPQIAEKLTYLANEVDSSDFQPTTQQVAVHDELKEQAATYRQRLRLLLEQDVTAFNGLLRQHNVPNIITGPQ